MHTVKVDLRPFPGRSVFCWESERLIDQTILAWVQEGSMSRMRLDPLREGSMFVL